MLWVRALLNSAGELDDGVAMELLPPSSRWLVGEALAPLWAPAMEKLGWIAQRTAFIDEAVDAFLASGDGEAQVVLLGSGYDTRALRYAGRGAKFFEVDLPNVVEAKRKMSAGYCAARGVAPAPRSPPTSTRRRATCSRGSRAPASASRARRARSS